MVLLINSNGFIDLNSFGPVIVGVVAIFFTYLQFKKTLDARKREEEIREIDNKLNSFYGPLIQLRKKSYLLYSLFAKNQKREIKNYRTLIYLLEGNKFSGNDEALLKEIISIGERCSELVENNAGLIDDEILRSDLIPKMNTHYLLLKLSHHGVLSEHHDEFKDFVFPSEIDSKLEERYKYLQERLKELNDKYIYSIFKKMR